jgi:hypothetical protein
MRLFLTLVACALLTTGGLWAQTQPADATNAQDEQVNIVISPPADGDISSLSILRTDDFTVPARDTGHGAPAPPPPAR